MRKYSLKAQASPLRKLDPKPTERVSDIPGCAHLVEYRAPKARDRLE